MLSMTVLDGFGNTLTEGLEPTTRSDQARQVAQRLATERGEPVWLVPEPSLQGEDGERFDPAHEV